MNRMTPSRSRLNLTRSPSAYPLFESLRCFASFVLSENDRIDRVSFRFGRPLGRFRRSFGIILNLDLLGVSNILEGPGVLEEGDCDVVGDILTVASLVADCINLWRRFLDFDFFRDLFRCDLVTDFERLLVDDGFDGLRLFRRDRERDTFLVEDALCGLGVVEVEGVTVEEERRRDWE